MDTTIDRSALEQKLIPELQRIAQEMGIEGTQRLRKAGLIDAIVAQGGDNGSSSAAASPSCPCPPQRRRTRGRSGRLRHRGAARRAPLDGRRRRHR